MTLYLGCAGWGLNARHGPAFPGEGSHLQRYAAVLPAVEVNSTFYRPHRPSTFARWASVVPPAFRFCLKLPKAITHEQRLHGSGPALQAFFESCAPLAAQLGCVLVQLPPSLVYAEAVAAAFFAAVRKHYAGPLVLEPRHPSWQAAGPLLVQWRVAQVAADPAPFPGSAEPAGWPGLRYWRLHGSPRRYYSEYAEAWLDHLAGRLLESVAGGVPTWCVFDNTAAGAALGNALYLHQRVSGL